MKRQDEQQSTPNAKRKPPSNDAIFEKYRAETIAKEKRSLQQLNTILAPLIMVEKVRTLKNEDSGAIPSILKVNMGQRNKAFNNFLIDEAEESLNRVNKNLGNFIASELASPRNPFKYLDLIQDANNEENRLSQGTYNRETKSIKLKTDRTQGYEPFSAFLHEGVHALDHSNMNIPQKDALATLAKLEEKKAT